MRARTLHGYLLREGLIAWVAVTLVLLGIMLATRFARYLAEAAAGQLPREFLMKVVGLSSLQYLVILIPVSLLLAVMLALGRMYRDQEISAMTGCGVGPMTLYRPFLVLTGALAVLTGALSLQVGPWAGRQVDFLFKDAQRLMQFTPFEPGHFRRAQGGRAVFYTAARSGDELDTVFALLHEPEADRVITARRGTQGVDAATGDRVLRLEQGFQYAGVPGRAEYDVLRFDAFVTRIAPPEAVYLSSKRKIMETGRLLRSDAAEDRAELEWRIAAPVSVILLGLLAVPLAHASPREGRYGKLVVGLLAYLLYSNLLALGQAGIAHGVVPPGLGLWAVHGVVAAGVLWLIARRLGWVPPVGATARSGRRGRR